jgi:hypothetical protein
MPDFTYQTLQMEDRTPFVGGPSAEGEAIGAGIKLLQKASVALNSWAVSWRVNREIEARAAQIKRQMPARGGVLLCIGIQEWEAPDPAGVRAQSFLSLHIVGSGPDPVSLLNRYQMQPQLVQGAPKGWRRKDCFIWVTPSTL